MLEMKRPWNKPMKSKNALKPMRDLIELGYGDKMGLER